MSVLTEQDGERPGTVPEALAVLADRFGDREAVVAPEGRITFADLARRCEDLAGVFAAAGLRRGIGSGSCCPTACGGW
ncbi:hypothetical protein [Prauserella flavalba]|uniref:hypothetical protein n=1 Tax=Prauserella flavalba TaxID=1477506 RepID=UPI0036EFFD4B